MGLFDVFKRKSEIAPPDRQDDSCLTAEELFDQGKVYEAADPQKAFQLFLESAKKGWPPAMNKVGFAYFYQGRGAHYDAGESVSWFQKGADAGEPGCMMMLSQYYMAGVAVPQSDAIAKQWLQKAAASENEKIAATASRRLSDYDASKMTVCALMKTAEEMGGIPPR